MSIVNVEKNFAEIIEGKTLIEVHCPDSPSPDLYNFQNSELKIVQDKQQFPLVNLTLQQFIPRGS